MKLNLSDRLIKSDLAFNVFQGCSILVAAIVFYFPVSWLIDSLL